MEPRTTPTPESLSASSVGLPPSPASGHVDVPSEPIGSRVWHTLVRNPLARAGTAGLLFIVLFSFAGPLLYRVSPYAVHMTLTLQGPRPGFPLGTNNLGRDELARLMLGGQTSLIVGITAAISSVIIGVIYGLVSGLAGGWTDTVMMRGVDVLRSIPTLFLLIFFDSIFRPSTGLLVALIAFVSWYAVSRLVRAEVLSLRTRPYVEASVAQGSSQLRIMFRHLLPNAMGTIIVASTFMVADSILLVAALSFLGLGLPPPAPNWGSMLSDSIPYLQQNSWWLVYPPGLAILITVISINFLGDAFREAFDRRLSQSTH